MSTYEHHKKLAKITSARFGFGGYDDAMVGLNLTFGGDGFGVSDFTGTWSSRPASAAWTLEDQRKIFADVVELLRDTLRAAKRKDVSELAGSPVELTMDGNRLSSWRILTEVL